MGFNSGFKGLTDVCLPLTLSTICFPCYKLFSSSQAAVPQTAARRTPLEYSERTQFATPLLLLPEPLSLSIVNI